MARFDRLTYERLISSLERHYDAVVAQLPELKDTGRVQDLQRVINAVLTTARAGMSGALVTSPARLKQELKSQIADIHQRRDALEKASVHAQDGTQISASTSSASSGNHDSSLASSQQKPAPKCARGARDSSKENDVPPTVPVPQPASRKVSAVRKTPIIKRAASSQPSTNAGIKKRPARATRSKVSTQDLTATLIPAPDDAELAAADALVELKRSPETSFTSLTSSTSSSTFITPSTNGKKRTYSVYEDDTSSPYVPQSQQPKSSSPALKRRMLAPATYLPVPQLARGLSVPEAFALGVEYVVQHLPAEFRSEGEEMRAWVEQQLGLQVASLSNTPMSMSVSNTGGGMTSSPGDVEVSNSAIGGGRRGFWDVI